MIFVCVVIASACPKYGNSSRTKFISDDGRKRRGGLIYFANFRRILPSWRFSFISTFFCVFPPFLFFPYLSLVFVAVTEKKERADMNLKEKNSEFDNQNIQQIKYIMSWRQRKLGVREGAKQTRTRIVWEKNDEKEEKKKWNVWKWNQPERVERVSVKDGVELGEHTRLTNEREKNDWSVSDHESSIN